MSSISAFVKEFGEVLGLPDLAARSDNAGSDGLGPWCAMSDTLGNGRPQHLCAWAKEKLGWLKPAVIDPTVKQKLILSPIEDSPKECLKVLVRPDGSEYFLLENRAQERLRCRPARGGPADLARRARIGRSWKNRTASRDQRDRPFT